MLIIGNKKWDAMQQQLKALQTTTISRLSNFSAQIYPTWKQFDDAYASMDMVYSVIKKLATNAAMIPFYGYDSNGKDLSPNDPLVKFLSTLDFEQKEIMYTYLWDRGEVFAYKNKLEFGKNAGLNSLTFLHPAMVNLRLSSTFPVEITGYTYRNLQSQEELDIEVEDMIYIRMPNTSTDQNMKWRGLSAADVLRRVLTRVTSEDDVSVAQLQNGGTPAIVYDKTPNLAPGALGVRKDTFGRFLSNSSNKGAPYFAAGEMGHIPLGSSLVDMNVAELASLDFGRICNAFGVSTTLFNDKSASTESNVKEMKAEMYENTIIPNVHRVESALNRSAVPDIATKGYIRSDTSEIKALQEDESALVNALAAAWWLKGNEKRERMAYDRDDNELLDTFIIPSGMMLIEDLEITDDLENTGEEYANVVPLKRAQ